MNNNITFEWSEDMSKLDVLFDDNNKNEYNKGFDDGIDFMRTIITSDDFSLELYRKYGYKIDNRHIQSLLDEKYRISNER
jgi:hypothetical protein